MTDKIKEEKMNIENILLEFGNRLLDVANNKESLTFGELLEPPTAKLNQILIEARIDELTILMQKNARPITIFDYVKGRISALKAKKEG